MSYANKNQLNGCGFTLVELLVVVGVIALLIGVLLPALSKARAQANRAVCLNNIRQLGIGILLYCQDNQGYFPTCAYWADGPDYAQCPYDWIYWEANRNLDDSPIAHYLNAHGDRLKSLLRCPADNFDGRKAALGILSGQGPYLYSYGMNDALAVNFKRSPAQTKITSWRAPSLKIMLTEVAGGPLSTSPVWGYADNLPKRHGIGICKGNTSGDIPGKPMGINVSAVFLDGHAAATNDDLACNISQDHMQAQ